MICQFIRRFSTTSQVCKKSLILGVNVKDGKDSSAISTQEEKYLFEGSQAFKDHDKQLNGKLTALLNISSVKPGKAKTFFNLHEEYPLITVVGINSEKNNIYSLEYRDESKESIRCAISAGIQQLKESGIDEVDVDVVEEPFAAAEGAFLASWSFKLSDRNKYPNIIEPLQNDDEWKCGKIYAEAQNWARFLMDSPANMMTPTLFAAELQSKFEGCETKGSVDVIIRDEEWIVEEKMGAFLSVSQGSDQKPKFVEVHYSGADADNDERPLVLVGKGVTFDSGGISIKPSAGMDEMRGDMGGAATIAAAILASVRLNVGGKIIGLFPLCENLINGKSTKPGDVITARNNVTIQIDNTDAEGRLLLADALSYGQDFSPSTILDAATLTGAVAVALGSAACGVYVNDDELWKLLEKAGSSTGDRFWRMPLYNHFTNQIKPSHLADINNVGRGGRYGGSCTAAAFLKHFIKPDVKWAHLDIAGVMMSDGKETPYLAQGMSGRPTRTIAEFIKNHQAKNL